MQFNSKTALLIMLLLIVVCINITYWIGESEKDEYERDYELFSYSKELIRNQEPNKAIPLLHELINKYQNDENITTYLAIAQVAMGEYDIAVSNFQKVLGINPNFQLDPHFNLRYSRALILNNEHEKAKLLLDKISNYRNEEQFKNEFVELYALIEQKNK
ncbi:tetratricopeptide repeat protein [Neobacillus sp. LXY-4]|uniref:tetratricopeptide repeat protein n=1 Tax=Neobacillus sp. LXY-4 TaxID=3379826 RepID=UPI003EE1B8EE